MKIVPIKVELLDRMGSDLTVTNTARVSFSKFNTEFDEIKDTKLINYLARENHWTPFGHCFTQFRVKAPVFVARQLVKHQIGLVWNEESRRYIDSEPEFYIPEVWRSRPEGSIKQGSGSTEINTQGIAEKATQYSLTIYESLLQQGVAPEQARMVLPLNTMTEWIWTGSLAAWARVCKLRLDSHAQKETAEVAQQISKHMSELFPVSWKALT